MTCSKCKYFTQCGDQKRTEPCQGYECLSIDERRTIMKSIMKFNQTPAGNHLIMQSYGDYTLIAKYRDNGTFHEYVVCNGYNAETGTWWHGHYFHHDLNGATEFLKCQDEEYVSRLRLEEIATKVLHICKDDDGLMYEIDQEVDFRPSELEYFGLIEEDDDDYTPSAENGDYSPSNPWDAPGMNIWDFI